MIYKAVFLQCITVIFCIVEQSCSVITHQNHSVLPKSHLKENYEKKKPYLNYKPTWDSLDSRPIPPWFDEAKIGIFIHWGVFSVPSFDSEWFWINWKTGNKEYEDFMKKRYKPDFSYQDFARDFTAEFFNPNQWSEIFEASGAKYIVLTSKHHEGYTLWPSKYSFSWNAVDVGPHRDLIGELSTALRKNTKLRFGLYHSLFEWFNPLYLYDKKNNFSTDLFVTNKVLPEMKELINLYKPEVLWSDGDWETTEEYWKSKEFLAWLYNESPVKDSVVTNDRWGLNTACKHGSFYNCQDRYNPGVLQNHKWENAMSIDKKSWGFRRNARLEDYYTLKELIAELVITVSTGGNLLMNIGPTKDGIIPLIFEELLRGVGHWLKINGEAIYETKPWVLQNDTITKDVWYTQGRKGDIYATLLSWPKDNTLLLTRHSRTVVIKEIKILSTNENLKWISKSDHIIIQLPPSAHNGEPAWVLKINHDN